MVITSVLTNFLVSKGYGNYVGFISTIGVVLNIILSFSLIPKFGIYGFFIGQIAGYGFGFVLVARKEFAEYNYPDVRMIKKLAIILLVGCLGLFPLLMGRGVWMEVYKVAFIGCVIVVLYFMAFTTLERTTFISMLKTKQLPWKG
jgi:O-antigen/teichoic acid export membrane protein